MTASRSSLRPLLIALVGVALVSQSGCVWMRTKFGRTAVYEDSPQVKPLEVPPGLDVPMSSGTVVVIPPPVAGAAAAPAAPAAMANGFTLADTLDSSFRRVGVALGKIDGVTMGESAQLLHTHSLTYQGAAMLIRVEAAGAATRVFALNADGTPLTSDAANSLLTLLKARLG